MTQLQIPYIDFSTQALTASFLIGPSEVADAKARALTECGVTPLEGEEPVDAWGRHIHEINGLKFEKPYHPIIREALVNNPAVYKFFFFLA